MSKKKTSPEQDTVQETPEKADNQELQEKESPEAKIEEIRGQLMRALADAENTRKRAQKEKEEALKFGMTGFAREILSVADNLERALESLKDSPASVREGVEMTQKQLLATFEKFDVRPINALGETFDSNLHQAVMEVEDADKPAGTVATVMQTGYTIQDRLLRPAMVSVVKS